MRLFLGLVLWTILLVMSWPLALLLLLLFPVIWLISLPLRLLGFTVEVVFQLLKTLFFLPFRVVGIRV